MELSDGEEVRIDGQTFMKFWFGTKNCTIKSQKIPSIFKEKRLDLQIYEIFSTQ